MTDELSASVISPTPWLLRALLAALGATKIHRARSRGSAFAIPAVVWLIFTGGMAALTSMAS